MPTYIRVKDLPNAATSPAADDFILLSGAANGARRISRADFLAAVAGFYTSDPSTYKLATLDAGNKVLVSQLPSSAFSYQGTWAASTNTPTLANGTGTGGDTYYASDSGSVDFGAGSISFLAGDAVVYDGSVWQKVPDVVNLLDGKGTLDEAKTTLEIPDVGSNPDEVSLNGMLGSMAFQSAEAVSVAQLQGENAGLNASPTDARLTITDSTNDCIHLTADESTLQGPYADTQIRMGGNIVVKGVNNAFLTTGSNAGIAVDSQGRTGIGTDSPGSYSADADDLVVGNNSATSSGVTIATAGGGVGSLYYADGTVNPARYQGFVKYNHGSDSLYLGTDATTRWTINSTGNLIAGSGLGIDFGSTGDGSGSGQAEILDDFETGQWSPQFYSSGGTLTAAMDVRSARYVKVGHSVTVMCYIRSSNINNSSASGSLRISGLPYAVAGSDNYTAVNVGYAINWSTAPAGGYTETGQSNIILTRWSALGENLSASSPADLTNGSGTNNEIMLTATYCSF